MTILNRDLNLSTKNFAGATELYVTSFFRTLQGEGPYAGCTAVFIRLAGCNFGAKDAFCQFCDTSFQLDRARKLTVEQVALELNSLYVLGDILVVTGGEPTLQHLILDVISQTHFKVVQFESNGRVPSFWTRAHNHACFEGRTIILGVSPKASYLTGKYPPLPTIVANELAFLKFALSSDVNDPAHKLPDWVDAFIDSGKKVYVSPITVYKRVTEPDEVVSAWDPSLVDHEATSKNYSYAANYVLNTPGICLSLQTHLFVSVP